MTMTRILAVVNGTPESRAVIRAAVAMGKERPCLIDGIHVRSNRDLVTWTGSPIYAGPLPVEVINQLRQQQDERSAAARAMFEAETTGLTEVTNGKIPDLNETTVRWQEIRGSHWDTIAEKGRTHDLIFVTRPTMNHWESETHEAEAALFDSGHGVLVVPQEAKDKVNANGKMVHHVAIAWRDTPEAARSITAATPFFENADRVSLIIVTDSDEDPSGLDEINEYFLHKGVDVEIVHQSDNGKPVADQILDCVADLGADLLVMGAYGHSRFREMVLGGATRGILRDADVPVLMAH